MARPLEGTTLSEQIKLLKWDPEGDTYVVFQHPARWESEQIATMQSRSELVWNTEEQGQVSQRDRTPLSVLETEMVAMSLVECNLPDVDGKLVFVPGTSCRRAMKGLGQKARDGFLSAWYKLPDELAEEIVEALRDFHPPFNWRSASDDD